MPSPERGELEVKPALRYPHECLIELPSKLTATGIGRGYCADEAAEETAPPRREVRLRAPLFDPAERRLSPAEAGTAHHLFMQFCDFAEAEKPGGRRAGACAARPRAASCRKSRRRQ